MTPPPSLFGEYAAFIWPAYGVTAVVLAWLAVRAFRALRRARAGS